MSSVASAISLDGACHCGAVRLRLPFMPASATSCNCSLCRRTAAIIAYFEFGSVLIEGHPQHTQAYEWGDRSIRNFRCKHCGVLTHWEPIGAKTGDRHGVNLRNFDTHVIDAVELRYFDGADSWTFVDGFKR